MMNPDVDGCAKTLNHRKLLRKTQKNNLMKTKTRLKPKYSRICLIRHLKGIRKKSRFRRSDELYKQVETLP